MTTTSTSTTPPGHRADQLIERGITAADFVGVSTTSDQLFADAFAQLRDPRSDEYKAGVRAALAFRFDGVRISRPYPAASAQDDAFDGGLVEGHAIWRKAQAVAGAA